jgi:RecA-family ATPase
MTDHPHDPEFFRQIASVIGDDPGLKDNIETERERYRGANGVTGWVESETLCPVDPATLDGVPVPPRQWLVPDWVPMGRVTALYGAGGEGKTILGQMLATACAIDALWLGLRVQRSNSLLLFCEDDLDEMHRRQDDINRHFGCTFADLTPVRWLPRLGADNALMAFDGGPHRTPLFDELLHVAKEHNARLIITDTLADVFAGNENDRGQARIFAQASLGLLARETQGAVVALAHPSRWGMSSGSGESGSTAWLGTFRSLLHLATPKPDDGTPPDPEMRLLTRTKSNAARRDETIELRWKDGVFVPSHAPSGIVGSIERRTCEQVFLDLLDKTTTEGQPVSSNSRAANYAPRLFASRPERERFTQADFQRAMQALFASGGIANQEYGRKSDMRSRIINRRSQEATE